MARAWMANVSGRWKLRSVSVDARVRTHRVHWDIDVDGSGARPYRHRAHELDSRTRLGWCRSRRHRSRCPRRHRRPRGALDYRWRTRTRLALAPPKPAPERMVFRRVGG